MPVRRASGTERYTLTEFQVLLGAFHELGNPSRKTLGNDKTSTAEVLLAEEKDKNLHQVGE